MTEATKKDLKSLLLSHEKRETKAQEDAESPEEQKLEAKAGIHESGSKKTAASAFSTRNSDIYEAFDTQAEHSAKSGVPTSVIKTWRGKIPGLIKKDPSFDALDAVEHVMAMEDHWHASKQEKSAFWRGFDRRAAQ